MDLLDVASIREEELADFWAATTLALVAAAYALYSGLSRIRLARRVEDMPTSRIRSAHQGYVELHGTIVPWPGGLLSAPLSGRPCVWYSYRVERRSRNRWSVTRSGKSEQPFQCDDDTGRCAIYPKGARVHASDSRSWQSGSYRHTESLLNDGDNIYALGYFRTVNQVARPLPIDNPIPGTEEDSVDDNTSRDQTATNINALIHTLSRPPDRRFPLLISNHTEPQLAKRLQRAGWIGVAIFLIAGAIATRLLVARFLI
ncbi:MAG: hypothetical protein DHS20C01_37470 [marine bacterium B5-7]|nr:MAG: hypothetical protein DHS20C01_37470 [marine bacterium B5-7]